MIYVVLFLSLLYLGCRCAMYFYFKHLDAEHERELQESINEVKAQEAFEEENKKRAAEFSKNKMEDLKDAFRYASPPSDSWLTTPNPVAANDASPLSKIADTVVYKDVFLFSKKPKSKKKTSKKVTKKKKTSKKKK